MFINLVLTASYNLIFLVVSIVLKTIRHTYKMIESVFHLQFFDLMLVMAEPTASGVFCNRMLSMVNSEDVNAIIQAQRHMWVSHCQMWFVCSFTPPSLISFACKSKLNDTSCFAPVSPDKYSSCHSITGWIALKKPMKCWLTSMGYLMWDYNRWMNASYCTPAPLWRWRKIWTASSEGSGKLQLSYYLSCKCTV